MPSDRVCVNHKSLQTVLSHLPHPWELAELTEASGCKKPCSYFAYEVREIQATSAKNKYFPDWDSIGFVTLTLATDEIQTIKDKPAFSIQALLNDFAGNSGMLLGISILDILLSRGTGIAKRKNMRIMVQSAFGILQMILLILSLIVVSFNYQRFRENKIR